MTNSSLKASPQSEEVAWYVQAPDKVLQSFGSAAAGLTSQEAELRLTKNGSNELKEGKRISVLKILLGQFKSLIIWILIGAGLISGILGEILDAVAIIAIVILNAVIGFYQEYNAEKSIAALKKMTAPLAKVRRNGQVQSIPAAHVVIGDILALEAGDLVAADARLLETFSLKCIESALTGESEAVSKKPDLLNTNPIPLGDQVNMVFMGTTVAAGTGLAVVVATAMNTALGQIAGLINSAGADEETPLQKKLNSFGRILVWATLGIVTLLFGFGWFRGIPIFELFLTSVSLAVAAVPEGLPAVVTVALSLGVMRMARQRALVRKLSAVETLGSTSVICTDKTGTLTVGEMTARGIFVADQYYEITGEGFGPEGDISLDGKKIEVKSAAPLNEIASILIGCNNSHVVQEKDKWKAVGDPTEVAMLVAGIKAGGNPATVNEETPKLHEIPFDSDRKRSTVIRQLPDGKRRAYINGSPDDLLQKCSHLYTANEIRVLTKEDADKIRTEISTMANQALRVLGSAFRDLDQQIPQPFTAETVENNLVFVGLTGMYDPPRTEAKDAIFKCHEAGIRVVMITGDHPHTATAIAKELGITSADATAVSGLELDKISDIDLQKRVGEISVYARVTAAHKLRIIRAFKENQDVVAMTGDGVNDAPAIKGADIGIAMGIAGTEVTKQSADMIITDDNFATIVEAVEEGRGIYDNIRKTLQFLLAGNSGELILITICLVVGMPTPLLPIHLLWINLVTDGLPALFLAADPIDKDVMKRKPRSRTESITNRRFFKSLLITGSLTAGTSFVVYFYVLKTGTLEQARVSAFSVLVFAELLRAFGARSAHKPVWRISLFSNKGLLAVVLVSIGLQFWSQHSEIWGRFLKTSYIPFSQGFLLLALGAIPLVVLEILKVVRKKSLSQA